MKATVGRQIEEMLEKGEIQANQVCVFFDKNNNINWLGKAEFAPIYLDWETLYKMEYVGNELRFNEGVRK